MAYLRRSVARWNANSGPLAIQGGTDPRQIEIRRSKSAGRGAVGTNLLLTIYRRAYIFLL
jgi:hypothetical protein